MDTKARLEVLYERRKTLEAVKRLARDGVPLLVALAVAEELTEWKIRQHDRIDILA